MSSLDIFRFFGFKDKNVLSPSPWSHKNPSPRKMSEFNTARLNPFIIVNKRMHISTPMGKYNLPIHGVAMYDALVRTDFFVLHTLEFLQHIFITIYYTKDTNTAVFFFFRTIFFFFPHKKTKNIHHRLTLSKNNKFLSVLLFFGAKMRSKGDRTCWYHMRHLLAYWTKKSRTSVI